MLSESFQDSCVRRLSNYLTKGKIVQLPIEIKIGDTINNPSAEGQFNHIISFQILHNNKIKDSAGISKILNNNKPLHAEYTEYISTQLQGKFTFTKDFAILNKRPGYFMIDPKKSVMGKF